MIGESRLVAGDNEVTVVSDGDEVKLNVPDVSKFNLLLDYNDSVDTTAVSINGDIADARIDENGDVYVSGKSVTGLTQIVITRTIKNSNGTSAGSEKACILCNKYRARNRRKSINRSTYDCIRQSTYNSA